ncbi:unnamed protein product [Gongylonema pulchrum]|uniref:Thioredoxin domain-containing protein n=1 Tax=Gongylonema pulchrum TaxID=637853 RepID=A0A183DZ11_9BILA|nr:unnamed protein product [Gongylonema pulchrum]
MLVLLLINALFNAITRTVYGEIATMGRQPLGINPTLYDSKVDPIMQLDEMTFNDTVFCKQSTADDCTAYVVEFYSDWCGHCRAYAQTYKSLAHDIHGWDKVVRVAAMNCADPLNDATCQANGVLFFPYIRYFPRNSSSPEYGLSLKPMPTVSEMRGIITESILLILDMSKYSDRLVARRCLKSHPLADALHIRDFPTLAIFKREQRTPLLVAEYGFFFLNIISA